MHRLEWAIAFAGVLPFAVATVAMLWGDSHIRVPAIAALVTFAAIILSYLGGIEWGLALQESAGNERTRALGLGFSTLPALAAWGILWAPSPRWQVGAALGLFIAVWAADLALSRHGLVPAWFVDLRTAITAVVAVILGFALYLL